MQQYGKVEETLRPGWSEHELLTPERFEQLLGAIRETKCVVTCIVDVFDLKGSILKNLRQIAGNNPIVIAVNKVDLLPKDMSETRVMNWIYSEIMTICGLRSPKEAEQEAYEEMKQKGWTRQKPGESEEGILRRANIHLVSCQSGHGMDKLMESLSSMAISCGSKVYVMGAANVGKSSFINRLLDGGKQNQKGKVQKRNGNIPKVTVSNLPGTTLDFLKIVLPNGITMVSIIISTHQFFFHHLIHY